jgi:small subunit ribosomal protein S2e
VAHPSAAYSFAVRLVLAVLTSLVCVCVCFVWAQQMADAAPADGERRGRGFGDRGGFGRGRGRGDRGRGDRGRGGRGGRGGKKEEEKGEWVPVTKLGRLVKGGKIPSLEHIYLHSLPIKEYNIVDYFLNEKLKDEVMKIMPVQKQTSAGQRTRFKAIVVVGDFKQHIGLGVKTAKEVATAIRGALINAKINVVPIRLGYWGNKIGEPHTLPMKVHGKCGSVHVRLIPAPRGTSIVSGPVAKKLLTMAGVADCYSTSNGDTKTLGNTARAVYNALARTYSYLDPTLWIAPKLTKTPFQEHTDFLAATAPRS